jgi:hypothetical protein
MRLRPDVQSNWNTGNRRLFSPYLDETTELDYSNPVNWMTVFDSGWLR